MNERIRELAEQCTVSCIDGRGVELNEIDVEKFAELIVRECAKVCLAQRDPSTLNYKPSIAFADELRLHFGIKE